jgi:hypothetical protein
LGASRCDINQASAWAAAWLSSPALLCEEPEELDEVLAANAGTAAKTTTVNAANSKANRRIGTPLDNRTLLRATDHPGWSLAQA